MKFELNIVQEITAHFTIYSAKVILQVKLIAYINNKDFRLTINDNDKCSLNFDFVGIL